MELYEQELINRIISLKLDGKTINQICLIIEKEVRLLYVETEVMCKVYWVWKKSIDIENYACAVVHIFVKEVFLYA